jgi:hypothetical protein
MIIDVQVRNKIAKHVDGSSCVVCGNSDYTVRFDFDEEWDANGVKTAIFKWGGEYAEVSFTGTECPIPKIYDTTLLWVGVFAGDIRTSTDAIVPAKKSALCGKGVHHEPPEDVYNQLIALIDNSLVKGDDGITPHIGENGNWYIGDEDTGIPAEGKEYVLTETDKSEMVQSVLNSLPTWNGGIY